MEVIVNEIKNENKNEKLMEEKLPFTQSKSEGIELSTQRRASMIE